jgi:hypothetical protein
MTTTARHTVIDPITTIVVLGAVGLMAGTALLGLSIIAWKVIELVVKVTP